MFTCIWVQQAVYNTQNVSQLKLSLTAKWLNQTPACKNWLILLFQKTDITKFLWGQLGDIAHTTFWPWGPFPHRPHGVAAYDSLSHSQSVVGPIYHLIKYVASAFVNCLGFFPQEFRGSGQKATGQKATNLLAFCPGGLLSGPWILEMCFLTQLIATGDTRSRKVYQKLSNTVDQSNRMILVTCIGAGFWYTSG